MPDSFVNVNRAQFEIVTSQLTKCLPSPDLKPRASDLRVLWHSTTGAIPPVPFRIYIKYKIQNFVLKCSNNEVKNNYSIIDHCLLMDLVQTL